jgi:prepilin-type N-terminal cleavage/methylation domain-containing protein
MKRAFTLIELLIVLAILFLLVGAVAGLGGGCSRSEGSRAGIITKFSHKGNFVKSWEGELVLGGMRSGAEAGQVQANVWAFSVTDEALVPKIKEALRSGVRVELEYKQSFARNPLKRDTTYVITKVTPVGQ